MDKYEFIIKQMEMKYAFIDKVLNMNLKLE
jgi:hypothetical protein